MDGIISFFGHLPLISQVRMVVHSFFKDGTDCKVLFSYFSQFMYNFFSFWQNLFFFSLSLYHLYVLGK